MTENNLQVVMLSKLSPEHKQQKIEAARFEECGCGIPHFIMLTKKIKLPINVGRFPDEPQMAAKSVIGMTIQCALDHIDEGVKNTQ